MHRPSVIKKLKEAGLTTCKAEAYFDCLVAVKYDRFFDKEKWSKYLLDAGFSLQEAKDIPPILLEMNEAVVEHRNAAS